MLQAIGQTDTDSTDIYYKHLKLNEIVVTGLTGESRMKDMPAPVSIISESELQSTAATNLIDAISRQPGVSQITTGGAISKPVIRGLGYNRVAVVQDGVRQEGQQWGDEHGLEVDLHSTGSIEIEKGPFSLMYGSDAMAGVIILHSHKTPPAGKMRASLTTGYQTNNGLFDYSVDFAGNKKGFVWDGRWTQRLAHAYKNSKDGYVPGTQFQEQAATVLVGLNRNWGHSHLKMSYFHLNPSIAEGKRDAVTGLLLPTHNDLKSYSRSLPFQHIHHYKVLLDNSFSIGGGTLTTLLSYQQNRRKEFEDSTYEPELYFQLHTLSYDIRYQCELQHGWKLATGFAGMFQRSLNHGNEYLIPAYRLSDIGLFVTSSKQLGRWTLTGGLRTDHRNLHSEELIDEDIIRFSDFRRGMTGFSGSIGTVYNVSEHTSLRANLSCGFRAPNISELGANGEHEGTGRYEIGNHNLSPEYSWQADLGVDFSSRLFSAQLSLFANRISNYIFIHRTEEVFDPDCPTFRYNAGTARLLGFEAVTDFHPIHSLHFENTFSYVNAVQLHQPDESRYLPFTPAPRWISELKYELSHQRATLDNAYIAISLECYLRQNHFLKKNDTETATPAYTLVNLSAGTDIKARGRKLCSLYLSLNNLFDKAYQNHLSRLKYIGHNPVTGERGIYDMGRNFSMRITIPIL